jgi:hypothetical protein
LGCELLVWNCRSTELATKGRGACCGWEDEMELLTGLYLYVGYLLSDLLTDPSLPLFVGLHHGPTPLPITPKVRVLYASRP